LGKLRRTEMKHKASIPSKGNGYVLGKRRRRLKGSEEETLVRN